MKTKTRRSGFTLMEILIVMGILVLVAGILVPVTLSLSERNQVPRAASMLENALQVAKSQAVATKRPSGVRLILANVGNRRILSGTQPEFPWYDEIQFVQDPGDYVEAFLWGLAGPPLPRTVIQPFWSTSAPSVVGPATPYPGQPPLGTDTILVAGGPFSGFSFLSDSGTTVTAVPSASIPNIPRELMLFGPISKTPGNDWVGLNTPPGTTYRGQRLAFDYTSSTPYPVQVGDRIELNGTGELFRVVGVVTSNINVSGNGNPINCPALILDRALPRDVMPPVNGRPNFRIIRQPRIIAGMQPVKLPQGVVIDMTGSRAAVAGAITPPIDLDSSGAFFMSGVSSGIAVAPISGLTTATMAPRLVAPPYIDILFSPSGELIPTSQNFGNTNVVTPANQVSWFTSGASDLVALWLHSVGSPDLWAARQATAAQGQADNQALVTIHARTGAIGSFPMNLTPQPLYAGTNITTDPLYNVRISRGRTSGNTGP